MLSDCDLNPKVADVPVQFEKPIYGSSTPSFTNFVAPGVILTYTFKFYVTLNFKFKISFQIQILFLDK